jgi:hypothetical protein
VRDVPCEALKMYDKYWFCDMLLPSIAFIRVTCSLMQENKTQPFYCSHVLLSELNTKNAFFFSVLCPTLVYIFDISLYHRFSIFCYCVLSVALSISHSLCNPVNRTQMTLWSARHLSFFIRWRSQQMLKWLLIGWLSTWST